MAEGVPAGRSGDTIWLHLKHRAKASTQTRVGVLLYQLGRGDQVELM